MHLFLWAEDSEPLLRSELERCFGREPALVAHGSLLAIDSPIPVGDPLPHIAFARQMLPNSTQLRAASIREWVNLLLDRIGKALPEPLPWSLHIEPHYGPRTGHRIGARAWHGFMRHPGTRSEVIRSTGATAPQVAPFPAAVDPEAGRNRCRLIREELLELLRKKRRYLLRQLRTEPSPFTPADSLVQVLLMSPENGVLSVATAPVPHTQRHVISPYPKGEIPVAEDKTAPSRAFAKVVEAELRLGRKIERGETCVDLGAAPGSWTYVAVTRGARVIAVDRAPLREDLMSSPLVSFIRGDAFEFRPPHPVDWLLCDVIALPQNTGELLVKWLRNRWCRQFVITIKLQDASALSSLNWYKRELPPFARELFLTRLCSNKKEVGAFGEREACTVKRAAKPQPQVISLKR